MIAAESRTKTDSKVPRMIVRRGSTDDRPLPRGKRDASNSALTLTPLLTPHFNALSASATDGTDCTDTLMPGVSGWFMFLRPEKVR
jgi:hypothetical protein